jgi:hypothetical protein
MTPEDVKILFAAHALQGLIAINLASGTRNTTVRYFIAEDAWIIAELAFEQALAHCPSLFEAHVLAEEVRAEIKAKKEKA